MTLTVSLNPATEAKLVANAQALGIDLGTYAARLLERSVSGRATLEEISGEAGINFKKSGMPEEELGELLEREKHAARERELGRKFSE